MSAQERFLGICAAECSYTALDFARRTMRIYRSCVLRSRKRGYDKPHHASLPEYRRSFIQDYVDFKKICAQEKANGRP